MYIIAYDETVSPAREVVLDEAFLSQVEYRKSADGRTMISLTKTLTGTNINDNLETRTNFMYMSPDVQIDLYSGPTRLKSVRGCPSNYSLYDRGGSGAGVQERLDILVGGKIVGSNVTGGGASVPSGDGALVEYPPSILGVEYNKGTGELVIKSDHLLHALVGFIDTDFDMTKLVINGYRLQAETGGMTARGYTDHFRVTFKLGGTNKTEVDKVLDVSGTANSSGVPYTFIAEAGWNHPISTKQTSGITVATQANVPLIARAVYDVPTSVLTLFAQDKFAYGENASYGPEDFDGSYFIVKIGQLEHAYSYSNVSVISASSTQVKIQVAGNCVDFMNEVIDANGKTKANGDVYEFRTRAGWNGPTSTSISGTFEVTGYVDFKAPNPPTGLTALPKDGLVHIMSMPNTEKDVAGYNFYVNGVKHNTELVTDYMMDITPLENGKTYNFYMTAVDTAGNESQPSATITASPKDSAPPATPTGLMVMDGGSGYPHAMWTANTETDLAGYNLYVDGVLWNTGGLLISNMTDVTGLVHGELHNFQVSAVDKGGNESPKSAVVAHTCSCEPPTADGFSASGANHDGFPHIHASWTPCTESHCKGYNFYVGGVKVNTDIIANTPDATSGLIKFTYTNVVAGQTYEVYVTVVDDAGNESTPSVTITVTIPADAPTTA